MKKRWIKRIVPFKLEGAVKEYLPKPERYSEKLK
jgi:hypothetical protein